MLTQELNHLRELVSNTKKEIDSQESLILKLKEADSEHKRLLAAKEEQIDRKTKEQEELTRRITKTHEEYNSYKTNVLSSIESFLLEMLK